MGDRNNDYSYEAMSNKVQKAKGNRFRHGESTGEVETLRGRTGVGRMGDRVGKESRPRESERNEQKQKKQKKDHQRPPAANVLGAGGQSILDYDNLTGYQPTTQGARTAYETILVSHSCH